MSSWVDRLAGGLIQSQTTMGSPSRLLLVVPSSINLLSPYSDVLSCCLLLYHKQGASSFFFPTFFLTKEKLRHGRRPLPVKSAETLFCSCSSGFCFFCFFLSSSLLVPPLLCCRRTHLKPSLPSPCKPVQNPTPFLDPRPVTSSSTGP